MYRFETLGITHIWMRRFGHRHDRTYYHSRTGDAFGTPVGYMT
jgi:hypothetical protein